MSIINYPLAVPGDEIMQQDPGTLGARVRYARKSQRLTQQQLADASMQLSKEQREALVEFIRQSVGTGGVLPIKSPEKPKG